MKINIKHINLVLFLLFVFSWIPNSFANDTWPKCPPPTLDPIYVIENDSITLIFEENDQNSTFNFKLLKGDKETFKGKANGKKLALSINDTKNNFDEIKIQGYCNNIASRYTPFKTKFNSTFDISKLRGLIMISGDCIFIKSQLGTAEYNIISLDESTYEETLINTVSDSIYTTTTSEIIDINSTYLTIPGLENVYFKLNEENFNLNEINTFLDASQIIDFTIESIVAPTCLNDGGKVSLLTDASEEAIFSIDGGITWQNNPSFENLKAGNYKILVRANQNSCIHEISTNFLLLGYSKITKNEILVTNDCSSGGGGSIKIDSLLVPPDSEYLLNSGQPVNIGVFENLEPGYHNLTILSESEEGCNVSLDSIYIDTRNLLQIEEIEKQNVTNCLLDNDGSIAVNATIPEILYSFDSGITWESNIKKDSLGIGEYTLLARNIDSTCIQSYTTSIEGIDTSLNIGTPTLINPTCYGDSDGEIHLDLSNNQESIRLEWRDGDDQTNKINLNAGTYNLKAFNENFCYNDFVFTLNDPPKVTMENSLEDSILYLCEGSEIIIDFLDTMYQYEWLHDGMFFSDSMSASITSPGTYQVTGFDLNNCYDEMQFEVLKSDEIFNPNFLLPSIGLINDTIVGVEVTLLTPDSIIWEIPQNAQVLSTLYNQLALRFDQLGNYPVRMLAYKGNCWTSIEKIIKIVDDPALVYKDANNNQITFKNLVVRPNPNDGNFSVDLELNKTDDVRMILYDQNGNIHYETQINGILTHTESINLQDIPPGVYILKVNTNTSFKILNIVIY